MSWKPKTGHPYWIINSSWEVKQATGGSKKSAGRIAGGNCFKTADEAVAFRKRMLEIKNQNRWYHFKRLILG